MSIIVNYLIAVGMVFLANSFGLVTIPEGQYPFWAIILLYVFAIKLVEMIITFVSAIVLASAFAADVVAGCCLLAVGVVLSVPINWWIITQIGARTHWVYFNQDFFWMGALLATLYTLIRVPPTISTK